MLRARAIKPARSIKLLIIDDDPAFGRLLSLCLSRHGFVTAVVLSGEASLALAKWADVAVVDMMMPGMDGIETIAALRLRNPALVPMACSGCDQALFGEGLATLGVHTFLAKPFTVEALMMEIERSVPCRDDAGLSHAA